MQERQEVLTQGNILFQRLHFLFFLSGLSIEAVAAQQGALGTLQ